MLRFVPHTRGVGPTSEILRGPLASKLEFDPPLPVWSSLFRVSWFLECREAVMGWRFTKDELRKAEATGS